MPERGRPPKERLTLPTKTPAVKTPTELVHPATGEIVSVADVTEVARLLDECRALEYKLATFKRQLTGILGDERRRKGVGSTMDLPGGTRVVFSDSKRIEWDVVELAKLVKAGLPPERYEELVEVVPVSYKVRAVVATQIEKSNAKYARIIRRARTETIVSTSASVSR